MVKQGRVNLILLSCLLLASGCHRAPEAPFPSWLESSVPGSNSTGSFASYEKAADLAEKSAPSLVRRVSFTPGMKEDAIRLLKPSIALIQQAVRHPSAFAFKPTLPNEVAEHQRGWRLIGRTLTWRIEKAIAEGRTDDAASDTVLAVRFGLELSGGSATDASLGLTTVNEALQAVGPGLQLMSATSLKRLALGLDKALRARPSIEQSITHERLSMLTAVQWVQDSYRSGDFEAISRTIGPDSREAVTFLKEMKPKDASLRPAYFRGFANEAETMVNWLRQCSQLPASARPKRPSEPSNAWRPWKRFAKHFFWTAEPLLSLDDLAVARIRLGILQAVVRSRILATHSAPDSLASYPKRWTLDPYSGKPFVYRAEGLDYDLYSVGPNLQDDAGDSNETGLQPDLVFWQGD